LNHKISQNMRPIEAALTHVKARNESPNGYNRFPVPDDKVAWDVSYPAYQPNQFTAPSVLANDVSLKKDGWADEATPQLAFARRGVPQDSNGNAIRRDAEGFPMNPAGRTGTRGRGLLGKWGPNFAADPIVTRVNPKTGELEMLAIRRKDNGQWAIPGGMVDAGEMVSATLAREFEEEAGIRLDMTDARSVYRGYVDDPRNTDNAWMETTVMHKHLDAATAAKLKPKAGDDADAWRWMPLTEPELAKMYASHGQFVRAALESFRGGGNPDTNRTEALVEHHHPKTESAKTQLSSATPQALWDRQE